nr:esterase-like activity of phytase family protein [Gammaproteobacteria bacterium]
KKNNGFEGVAMSQNGDLLVAFQREWIDDPKGYVRIGRYSPKTAAWRFYYYPLDEVESPAGGWIGLSELTALGNDRFAVIERDNQRGLDAAVKRIYQFTLDGLTPVGQGGSFPVIEKTLARDILPDLQAPQGWVQDKPEGLAVSADGEVYLVTDNDGVDDSTGETQFLHLGEADELFED